MTVITSITGLTTIGYTFTFIFAVRYATNETVRDLLAGDNIYRIFENAHLQQFVCDHDVPGEQGNWPERHFLGEGLVSQEMMIDEFFIVAHSYQWKI